MFTFWKFHWYLSVHCFMRYFAFRHTIICSLLLSLTQTHAHNSQQWAPTKEAFLKYLCHCMAFQLNHTVHIVKHDRLLLIWMSLWCSGISVQRDKFRESENVNFRCVFNLKHTRDMKVRLEQKHTIKKLGTMFYKGFCIFLLLLFWIWCARKTLDKHFNW